MPKPRQRPLAFVTIDTFACPVKKVSVALRSFLKSASCRVLERLLLCPSGTVLSSESHSDPRAFGMLLLGRVEVATPLRVRLPGTQLLESGVSCSLISFRGRCLCWSALIPHSSNCHKDPLPYCEVACGHLPMALPSPSLVSFH